MRMVNIKKGDQEDEDVGGMRIVEGNEKRDENYF